MMKRFQKKGIRACALALSIAVSSANADDLMQVYMQAVQSDPVFAQALSTWRSQKMNLPIAEAGYLPQVAIAGSGQHVNTQISPSYQFAPTPGNSTTVGIAGETWQYGYSLTLTQQIFNFATWEKIKGADVNVKAATATYLAAQQSLMQRTAQAYFNVLQAYDQLRYTIANKRAVWQQYVTAREQFRVGLIAITDEYDARSKYDQVVAQQISSQNNLNVQLENLRVITGREYPALKTVGKKLPLITPQPSNMNQWVNVADTQNYSLKAQNYSVLAAMENIKQQAAGGYPSLSLGGGLSDTSTDGGGQDLSQYQENVGLALSYNPIQGGYVRASTKQARYDYVTASGQLDQIHRQVVDQTRTSFLNVLSYISQVKADKASIVSARNAVASTEAGFKVGTRTMVDVLDDLTSLYQAQQRYAVDEYSYLNSLIALKAAAGTLSVTDLRNINSWLGKSVSFPSQTSVAIVPTGSNANIVKVDEKGVINPLPESAGIPIESAPTAQKTAPSTVKQVQLEPPRATSLPKPAQTV